MTNDVEKKCEYCDQILIQKDNEHDCVFKKRRFCNRTCSSRHTHKNGYKPTTLNCQYCNKEFISKYNGHKYCSHDCFGKDEKCHDILIKTCEYCWLEYKCKNSADGRKRKFCTMDCFYLYSGEKQRGIIKGPIKEPVYVYNICQFCQQEFKCNDGVIGRNRKFCSQKCAKDNLIKTPTIINDIEHYWCNICISYKPKNNFMLYGKSVYHKCNECLSKYIQTRKDTDLQFKLKTICSSRINSALKAWKTRKKDRTVQLLGCTIQEYANYLESKFLPGMSWENHGKWHIDHIRPCSSFDLSKREEQFQCFNYKNTQPLWAKDNLTKSNKVIEDSI